MRKETEDILKKLRKGLKSIRTKAKKERYCYGHYIDLRYKEWDCPVDGLDYSISRIDKLLLKKRPTSKLK